MLNELVLENLVMQEFPMFCVAKTFSVANVLCWESSLSSNQAPSKSKCLSQFSFAFNWKQHVPDSFTIHTCYGKLCKKVRIGIGRRRLLAHLCFVK